ncbi:MAG: hypothetical protein HWN81_18455 [Candidatus Lokiarchaeota archaeon]|nr:hypothetical protein [Candidatus Lokiarchaeota archaeon]
MSKKIKYAYCKVCKHEVEKSSRKPLTTSQKITWVIISVATLGLGLIAYAIFLSNRPKSYCPNCFTKLEYSDEPFIKPKKKRENMTPREKILDKAGLGEEIEKEEAVEKKSQPKKKEKDKKKEKIFCEYCGEKLDEEYTTCPFCQATLKS